jgi:hypothetical protein
MNRLLAAAALVFCASTAHAGDAVTSLEHGVGYAKSMPTDRKLQIYTPRGNVVSLRPDGGAHGVIAVEKLSTLGTLLNGVPVTKTGHGYFLGANGKLSPEDRISLAADLKRERLDRSGVVYGMRNELNAHRAVERHDAAVQPTIDQMLADAKPGVDKQYGKRVRITTTAAGPTIMLDEGGWGSERGVFLSKSSSGGYSITPQERADIAKLLK